MNKFLRAANWIAIAFFGFAVLAIVVAQPSASALSALNLVPFGLALMAARADSKNSARWAGLLANSLWALLYIGIAGVVVAGLGGSLIAVPVVLLVAAPCVLNATTLWRSLRASA
ncbi:hypothetical protein [Pelomonas sp. KK5]|uniref:hypothetical protein n=1 Tax=Pelomonas sp. KK5 TaxID=1855730 RepID=UPI00117CFD0B|nr:hypothetical protein [Pelomonas sp. KK5]